MSLPFEGAAVCLDPIKGRCLEATRDFRAGSQLWLERAYVFASTDEDNEDSFEEDLEMWATISSLAPKKKNKKKKRKDVAMSEVLEWTDALLNLKSVASLDTIRCLLKLIIKALKAPGSELDNSAILFLQLEPSSLGRCIEDVSQFRAEHPTAFPDVVSTELIGRMIGVLNNNQMELEDIIGSGLFVASAILEHNCRPNCSFCTAGQDLYITATEAIKAGDRLSIDYGNNYCRPNFFRRAYLQKTYNFFCDCEFCEGPDRSRCFVCPSCRKGPVYAVSSVRAAEAKITTIAAIESGNDLDSIFVAGFGSLTACNYCGHTPSAEYTQLAVKKETEIVQSGLIQSQINTMSVCNEIWDEVNKLRHGDDKILHECHYLLFWPIDRAAEFTSQSASAGLCTFSDALDKAKEVERLMNEFLPLFHHEKVVACDKIGQLAVANGDLSTASEYFRKAYEMSVQVSGIDNPSTKKLNILATDTPHTVEELMMHYQNTNNATMCEELEDDACWVDED